MCVVYALVHSSYITSISSIFSIATYFLLSTGLFPRTPTRSVVEPPLRHDSNLWRMAARSCAPLSTPSRPCSKLSSLSKAPVRSLATGCRAPVRFLRRQPRRPAPAPPPLPYSWQANRHESNSATSQTKSRPTQFGSDWNQVVFWDAVEADKSMPRRLWENHAQILTLQNRNNPKHRVNVPKVWLRDACLCQRCVDPRSGRKNFGTCDIPKEPSIGYLKTEKDASIKIQWLDDFLEGGYPHHSHYTHKQLIHLILDPHLTRSGVHSIVTEGPRIPWNRQIMMDNIALIEFDSWMSATQDFYQSIRSFYLLGLILIKNVPVGGLRSLAQRIGRPRGGEIFPWDFDIPDSSEKLPIGLREWPIFFVIHLLRDPSSAYSHELRDLPVWFLDRLG
ncbi:hypothetical protein F4778DRAFT_713249 [Xylariomycetidae sp. FL2044]|nr:hypothetical protein F4778DRAFT_713249 [Xylariomycetidae sp. FL2044]